MKKNLIILTVLFICVSVLGTHRIVRALNLLDTIEITGNYLLPNLFYEHNLYFHKTQKGDIIYCLDPDKAGTEISAYKGLITNNIELYSNQQIGILATLIINGYPNKLPGTPTRNFSPEEFHCITSMAIRAVCMEFKGLTRGKTAEEYINVQYGDISAKIECIKLINYAKSNPCFKPYNELFVESLSNNKISDDGSMIYKEYMLVGNNIPGPIKITVDNIVNTKVILPDNLTLGNKFMIKIPIEETYRPINLKMSISGEADMGLVFIKAGLYNRQNYMGILNVNQIIKRQFDVNIVPNISKLKIFKKDKDTQEKISGATFRVWNKRPIDTNDKNNLVGNFVTDAEGIIEINNLTSLGSYYLKEIGAPVGYENLIEDEFECIAINEFGETYEKTIYNQQKELIENYIQIKGYKQVGSNQRVEYRIYGATNASNVALNNFCINIPVSTEYYELNNKITIGTFDEKQGYLMYLTDRDEKIYELKKSYNDENDYKLNKLNEIITRNIKGVFNCSDQEIVKIPSNSLKELLIKLAPESKGIEFKTPLFGDGIYSIYAKDLEKEYFLGSNYDGKKVNNFTFKNLRSYRIVFEKPLNIDEFKSGSFLSEYKSNHEYSLIFNTNKRENVLINGDLNTNKINIISIKELINKKLLLEGEVINKVSILFKDPVEPGLTLANPIILSGTSKDFNSISDEIFNGNRNNLYYSNTVEISGEYKEKEIKNGDTWDTGSYSKNIKMTNGMLPRTGSYTFKLFGLLSVTIGILLISSRRVINE